MILRRYQSSDCPEMSELFYNTVHTVNAADYTKVQLDAWASENIDINKWDASFREHFTVVAVASGSDTIIGFGDIDDTGYLDRLYVHKDYQGRGVASAICDRLERRRNGRIITHASITAKPFFEKRGYRTIKEQRVLRDGIELTNFVMEKTQ